MATNPNPLAQGTNDPQYRKGMSATQAAEKKKAELIAQGVPEEEAHKQASAVYEQQMGGGDPGGAQTPQYLNPPAAPPPGAPPAQSGGGNFSNTTDPKKIISENRQWSQQRGNSIDQDLVNQENLQSGLATDYRGKSDAAFDELQQTPGYTPEEAGKIGADYTQFETPQEQLNKRYLTGDEQGAIAGDPRSAMAYLNPKLNTGLTEESTRDQKTATQGLQQGLNGAIDPNKLGRSDQLAKDTQGAISYERGAMDDAIDPNKLGLDQDFASGYRMTDRDVLDQTDMAGRQVRNKYLSSEDQIERAAAAEGNTSPMAIAAAKERLNRDSATDEADSMTDARLKARQMQAGRNMDLEGMRTAGERDISTRQTNQAGLLGQQQINAANMSEETRMKGEQDIADRQMDAAKTGGQAAISTAYRTGQQKLQTEQDNQDRGAAAEKYGEAQSSERAGTLATNRQKTENDVQGAQYGQGMDTTKATAEGTQQVADARRSGQTEYRKNLTGQQEMAQQGQQTAAGQRIQNYSTETGAANSSANTSVANASRPSTWQKVVGAVTGAVGAAGGGAGIAKAAKAFADGGIVTEPTMAMVGERGPEAIVPLGPEQDRSGGQYGDWSQGGYRDGAGASSMADASTAAPQSQWQPGGDGGSDERSFSPLPPQANTMMGARNDDPNGARESREEERPRDGSGDMRTAQQQPPQQQSYMNAAPGAQSQRPSYLDAQVAQQQQRSMDTRTAQPQQSQQAQPAPRQSPIQASYRSTNTAQPNQQQQSQQAQPQPAWGQQSQQAAPPAQPNSGGFGSTASTAKPRSSFGSYRPSQQGQQTQQGQNQNQARATPDPNTAGGSGSKPSQTAAFASGGIVNKPTLALVGEKGPEAIVPLTPGKGAKLLPSDLLGGAKTQYQRTSGSPGPHGPVRGNLQLKQLPAYR